ncbi:MAG TPA: hypothetical protein VEH48_02060 [Candidatus Nitrosopolaris sp.]|nr:hypothetical protein [Candidatus Nitrosopolaris sp.]
MADAILIALIAAPLVLSFLLRSNAALGFLVLCTGFTAATYASGSTQHWLAHLASSGQILSTNSVNVIMIAVPLLITLLLTRKHRPRSKFYWEIIPALATGGLLALAVEPFLNDWTNLNLSSLQLWKQLQNQEAVIIGVGALASLLMIWLSGGKLHTKKHK